MKFLDDLIHKKVKPHFSKGGKFEKFYYLFEAGESFHFVTDRKTDTGAHVRDFLDLKRMMVTVVLALIPCLLFGIYNTGYQHLLATGQEASLVDSCLIGLQTVLPLMLVVYAAGGAVEALFAVVRKHEINEGFLVSGMLITLILPPTIPLWMAALGTIFGVFIGKEVFGGTGMNIMNPALTARAFLFFAYAGNMSGDAVWVVGQDNVVTQATPLAQAVNGTELPSMMEMVVGTIPGSIGETSVIACAIGALILLISGVASYKTMLGTLIGGVLGCLIFSNISDANIANIGILEHLVLGGFAFGLVFMCTDPVSSSQTETGKWIFGILTGLLAMTIRIINPAYPEGMMLAILFMNVFAPLIDHYVVKQNIKRRLARAKG